MKKLFLTALMFLAMCATSSAATYYISTSGLDSNNGTSPTTPWLHSPGMNGCVSNCNRTPVVNDRFIFRGGDTWHRGNSGITPDASNVYTSSWSWTWSGSGSGQIYIGVDNSTPNMAGMPGGTVGWYNTAVCGAAWCRPILQFDNPHSATESASCQYTGSFINMSAIYVTFDNFEMDGFCANTNGGGGAMLGHGYCGMNHVKIIDHYVHGWSFAKNGSTDPYYKQNYYFMFGDTGGCSPWPQTANEFAYMVFDDAPNGDQQSPHGTGTFLYGECENIHHNYLKGMANFVCNNGWNMHDNTWDSWDMGTGHANGMEYNGEGNRPSYFYNNKLKHVGAINPYGAGYVLQFSNSGHNEYVFNNVLYDTHAPNNYWSNIGLGPFYLFNNTLVESDEALQGVTQAYNNHWITTLGSLYRTTTPTVVTERKQTPTTESSSGAGYVVGNEYSPTAAYHPTAGAGTNYTTTICNTLVDADAQAACKLSTTGGVGYDTVNHKVITPAIPVVTRPTSGAWDIGAYQYTPSAPVWNTLVQLGANSGYVDTNSRTAVRTAAGVVYLASTSNSNGGSNGSIYLYKGSPAGNPTSFAQVASIACSFRAAGVEIRMADDDMIHLAADCAAGSEDGRAKYAQYNTNAATVNGIAPDTLGPVHDVRTGYHANIRRYESKIGLALDANRNPHLFWGPYGQKQRYTTITSGTYPNETWAADTTFTVGDYRPSAQFDAAGNLHVAVLIDPGANGHISYLQKTAAGTWLSPETVASLSDDVDSNFPVDSGPSLAIDKQGRPIVSWTGQDSGTGLPSTAHARVRTGTNTWTDVTLPSSPNNISGHGPSLYVDTDGNFYFFEGHKACSSCTNAQLQPYVNWRSEATQTWHTFDALPVPGGSPARDGSGGGRYDAIWPGPNNDIDYVTMVEDMNGGGQLAYIHGTGVAAPLGSPSFTFNPTSLTFASRLVGTTSPVSAVTLQNGGVSLSISSIGFTGTNANNFGQSNNCPATLSANASCTISVTFTPSAVGSRTASLTVTGSASGSISVSGTGAALPVAPVISIIIIM